MLLAFRVGNTRYWLFSDHLGSTAITANSSGTSIGELRYKAWGESRYSWGTTYTKRRFTGQIDETSSIGLYFFNARWVDVSLGRFTQPDSIIPEPGNPFDWDRYQYVRSNPLIYTDPTGRLLCSEIPWEEDCYNTQGEIDYTLAKRNEDEFTDEGKAMLVIFRTWQQTPGWWNEDGDFTLAEFIGLIALYEMSDQIRVEEFIVEATARQIWADATSVGGHGAYCGSGPCTVGALNFLGNYSQSAQMRVPNQLPTRPYGGVDRYNAKAASFGKDVLYPPSDWKKFHGDRPYHWGNNPSMAEKLRVNGAELGFQFYQIVYLSEVGDFMVYTTNQSNYWTIR